MSRFPIAALAVALIALAGAAMPVRADDAPAQQPRISVTGEGRVTAKPDMALLSLGVQTEAKTAAQAVADNATQTAAVLDLLREQGIEPRDIQTSGFRLSPVWDNRSYDDGTRRPRIQGFTNTNTLRIRLRDLDRLGVVLDRVVAAGANTVQGLQFDLADDRDLRDQARLAAIAEARRKAELYANAAGVSLGAVVSIAETGAIQPRPEGAIMMADARARSVPVAEGELAITASVSVVFALGASD